MKILDLLNSKVTLYIFISVLIVAGVLGALWLKKTMNTNDALNTYNRQLQGQLSDKEKELQSAHLDIGVAQSNFMTQKALTDKLAKEKSDVSAAFDAFVKKNGLVIESYQRTIAELNQTIQGGTSHTDASTDIACKNVKDCKISYEWRDKYNRFHLIVSDIWVPDTETFTSTQHFKVMGKIYKQSNGYLKVASISLKEMYVVDGSTDLQEVPGSEMKIDSSDFSYSESPPDTHDSTWRDLFRLRAIMMGSVTALSSGSQDRGLLTLGSGLEWFSYKGFGISNGLAFDFKDIKHLSPFLGLEYNPTLWNTELNLGIGTSIGTPFVGGFFKGWIWTINLIFYLNQ